jgi:hypothetical protein
MTDEMSRREFLDKSGKTAAGIDLGIAGAETMATATPAKKRVTQNDKILMGIISCGGMGNANMDTLMSHNEVEFVACCDVDSTHLGKTTLKVEEKG